MSENDAQAVIDTATRAAAPNKVADDLYSLVTPEGSEHHLIDLSEHLPSPKRKRGNTALHTADSLVAFIARHRGEDFEMYADADSFTITAVLNPTGKATAGWSDHRATLTLRQTPEWKRWATKSGTMMNQTTFAEFIEEGIGEIAEPPAAEMLELAQNFQAAVKVNFKSSRLLDNGQRQITYEETIDAKAGARGNITIPKEFAIGVAPFEGCVPYRVVARLRFRINDGALAIGYTLDHPEVVLRSAFDDEVNKVEVPTEFTAFRGRPA